jgi:predicted protein tyrosine phosphatase
MLASPEIQKRRENRGGVYSRYSHMAYRFCCAAGGRVCTPYSSPFQSVFTAFDQLSEADRVRATAGSANQVDPNVYISGYLAAADPRFIKRAGITRIVKLFADSKAYPGGYHRHPGVKYLVVAAEDVPEYDIRPAARAAVAFIRDGIFNGEHILVQCHAGVSRSATVVLFHLMLNRGYDLEHALARLKLVREFVNPNPGFMEHLRATDARLRLLRVGDEHRNAVQYYVAPPPILGYEAAARVDAARAVLAEAHDAGDVLPAENASLDQAAFDLRFARRGRYTGGRQPAKKGAGEVRSAGAPAGAPSWAFAEPPADRGGAVPVDSVSL